MRSEKRFPWVSVSAAVATLLLGVAGMLPSVVEGPGVIRKETLPKLSLTRISEGGATELLTEQILAYDPAPLFMPSKMNSSATELPLEMRLGLEGPFNEVTEVFTQSTPVRNLVKVRVPGNAVEGLWLAELPGAHLALGRTDEKLNPASDGVEIEVHKLNENGFFRVNAVTVAAVSELGDWQTVELLGLIGREGLVGELVVTTSSGDSGVDDSFRSLLSKSGLYENPLALGVYAFRLGR